MGCILYKSQEKKKYVITNFLNFFLDTNYGLWQELKCLDLPALFRKIDSGIVFGFFSLRIVLLLQQKWDTCIIVGDTQKTEC